MVNFKNPIDIVAAFGLALGAVFRMAGTFVAQPNIQALLWAIDGAGLVMAAALPTLKYFRVGQDLVAGGFLVFAIAEAGHCHVSAVKAFSGFDGAC
jgi:alpha-beta hydrolase superfamily lysophospholipase